MTIETFHTLHRGDVLVHSSVPGEIGLVLQHGEQVTVLWEDTSRETYLESDAPNLTRVR